MSGKLILVTGVSGFVAAHVAQQLLEKGYTVRGTARTPKIATLKASIGSHYPGLELVAVDDIATGDLTEALKGTHAIIHVASPLPGKTSVDDTLNSAIEGTLNVLRQASAAKIEKVVVTSSFGAILDPSLAPAFGGITLSEKDWGKVTREEVLAKASDPFYVYFSSKIMAEQAVWKYAEEHPELDIATILPGFIYGPYASHFPYPSSSALGTNGMIYGLLAGGVPPQPPPFVVDVRDVAKAHIAALDVPRATNLQDKRFVVNATNFTWKEAAEHLNAVRPSLKTAALADFPPLPGPASTLDNTRSLEVLKLAYIEPKKTVEDAIDSLLEAQKSWA